MSNYTLSYATLDDWAEIKTLFAEAADDDSAFLIDTAPATAQQYLLNSLAFPAHHGLILYRNKNKELKGYAALTVGQSVEDGRVYGLIRAAYLAPEERRSGNCPEESAGYCGMYKIEQWFEERGIKKVFANTQRKSLDSFVRVYGFEISHTVIYKDLERSKKPWERLEEEGS